MTREKADPKGSGRKKTAPGNTLRARQERAEALFELIRRRIPEEGIRPKRDKCLAKLLELDERGLSQPQIVGKFVETVMESPFSYLDIDKEMAEKLGAIKGSLGADYYNIQPRGKKVSAELIAVP